MKASRSLCEHFGVENPVSRQRNIAKLLSETMANTRDDLPMEEMSRHGNPSACALPVYTQLCTQPDGGGMATTPLKLDVKRL